MHLYKSYILHIYICRWILVSSHHAMSYNAMTWTACVRVCLYVCVRVWHDSWRKIAWMHDSISYKPAECNEPLIYWLLPIQGNVLSCPVTSCQVLDSIHDMHARLQGKRPVQASRIEMADMAGQCWTRMYSEGLRLDGMLCALAELRVGCERLSSCGRAHFNALLNRLEKPKESIVTAIVRERRIL
jgi:hypothetical protein